MKITHRTTLVLALTLSLSCEKSDQKHEKEDETEPVRVALGSCAGPTARFESGPRPEPFEIDKVEREMASLVAALKGNKKALDELKNGDFSHVDDRVVADVPSGQNHEERIAQAESKMGLEDSKTAALDMARATGILGALSTTEGGAFASLTGTGDFSSGLDDSDVYGGLLGDEIGEMQGGFGFGVTGTGSGGGGTGWGIIGSPSGSGYGTGSSLAGRNPSAPQVRIGNASAEGDLDKNIIRRYIRRKLPVVRRCYETRLLVQPKLAGTVVSRFTIQPNGSVASSEAKGVDPEVDSCIAAAIGTIQFPKPKGGGLVTVRYPFMLEPGKGESAEEPEGSPDLADTDAAAKEEPSTNAAAEAGRSPLEPHIDALDMCFRGARDAYGVLFVEMSFDDAKVSAARSVGIDKKTAACVEKVAKLATVAKPTHKLLRCPIAFGRMPIADATAIEIATEIRFGGKVMAQTASILKDASTEWKIPGLYQDLRVATRMAHLSRGQDSVTIAGPNVIRPIDATPMKVVYRVIKTVRAAEGTNWVLAAQKDKDWRFLNDGLVLPVEPVPVDSGSDWWGGRGRGIAFGLLSEPPVKLSVLVSDAIWIGTSSGDITRIDKREGAYDWEALASQLAEKRALPLFRTRRAIEISADEDVAYVHVVAAIDAANKAGFSSWDVLDPRALSVRFGEAPDQSPWAHREGEHRPRFVR